MSPTDSTTTVSPSTPCTHEAKSFRELDLVRDELGSLHPSEVRAPEGDEHLLGARVLDQLAQESFREHLGSSRADRVRVLALAMVQAQYELSYEPPMKRMRGYEALALESQRVFRSAGSSSGTGRRDRVR